MELSAPAAAPAQEETKEGKKVDVAGELETLEEMLSRHKTEITNLQNKELSMKKAAAKGSKAEQKAKKKQVEDEMSKRLSDLKTKHVKELATLGYNNNDKENSGFNTLLMAMSGVSVGTKASKPSKSAKNRERRAKQEAEREQRIQEEQKGIISDRMIENEKLERKLEPLGLIVKEIKPDGHCLYRAIEDQLSLNSGNLAPRSYQELRQMAAKYMREHASEFIPFLLSDAEVDEVNSSEKFEEYCKEVESTAAWGGQLELGALTHCLRKHFIIYSGSFPDIEMGREYRQERGSGSPNPSIMLSYHKHAYGLGEHYNSVVPVGLQYRAP